MTVYGYGYELPPTAVCPGCGELVVLPAEPAALDAAALICGTCSSEVPDERREGYVAAPPPTMSVWRPGEASKPHPFATPRELPVEERRYSRGGLFRSLGGLIAERGVEAVESAKERFIPGAAPSARVRRVQATRSRSAPRSSGASAAISSVA